MKSNWLWSGLKLAIFCIAIVSLFQVKMISVSADNRAYYINNLPGSNCSNDYEGTNINAPWCDFDRVNAMVFGPGDKILLRSGGEWNQEMRINGNGSATAWAEIGAYGPGAKPKIIRNGLESERAIRMYNPNFWKVSGLEIGYAGTGIWAYYDTKYNEGLRFDNLYLHHIQGIHQGGGSGAADRIWNSAGIELTAGGLSLSGDEYILKNITMENIEGYRNLDTISIDWFNGQNVNRDGPRAAWDVVLNRLVMKGSISGNGCDDGMRLTSVANLVLINSVFDGLASCHSDTGTAAIYAAGLIESGMYNNIIKNVQNTLSPDMVAFDYECCFNEFQMSGNYIADNAGAGISFLAIHGDTWDYSLNHTVSSNTFVNNGNGSIRRAGSDLIPNGLIRDNLYHEPYANRLLYEDGAEFSAFSINNNYGIKERSDVYHAAEQYSQVYNEHQWSYQYHSGSGWEPLEYEASSKRWKPIGQALPFVNKFEMHPDQHPTSTVARAWTAPRDGVIQVRGRVLKSTPQGGDGIVAQITKNDQVIWGPETIAYNDMHGLETNIDGLQIQQGEIIRFEVMNAGNNTYDATSWAPAIAYTAYERQWEFEGAATEGWNADNQSNLSMNNGHLELTAAGVSPQLHSPSALQLHAEDVSHVILGLTNYTSSVTGNVYFLKTDQTVWEESQSVNFSVYNNGIASEIAIDMRSNTHWHGLIEQLAIEFVDGQGEIDVDYIRLAHHGERMMPQPEEQPFFTEYWGFDTDEDMLGWTANNQITAQVQNGILDLSFVGKDPYIISPANLEIDADLSRYIKLKIKNNDSTPKYMQIYYATDSHPAFNGANVVSFTLDPGTDYVEKIIDMKSKKGWNGKIVRLRLDPHKNNGSVSLDSIGVASREQIQNQPYYRYEWGFQNDADFEGWTVENAVSPEVSTGHLNFGFGTGGETVALMSPDQLDFEAAYSRYIKISLTNSTATGKLLFITDNDTVWNNDKSVDPMPTNSSEPADIYFDMKQNPLWKDRVQQIRWLPEGQGNVSIEKIQITSMIPPPEEQPYYAYLWEFVADTQSWTLANQIDGSFQNNALVLNMMGNDPYMLSPINLDINADKSRYIEIDIKNMDSTVKNASIYFTTDSSPNFNESNQLKFTIEPNEEGKKRLDMRVVSGWTGTIKSLRFDPATASGVLNLYSIGVTSAKSEQEENGCRSNCNGGTIGPLWPMDAEQEMVEQRYWEKAAQGLLLKADVMKNRIQTIAYNGETIPFLSFDEEVWSEGFVQLAGIALVSKP